MLLSRAPVASFDRTRVNLSWLVRLRWAQLAGQASTIAIAHVALGVALPLAPLCAIVAAGVASNLAVEWRARHPRPVASWQVAAVMAVDVALLTSLLYFTGGPLNPFGFLYLVQIALATVLLHARLTWTLVALSFGGFGLLLLSHRPLAVPDDTRMVGMWVALGVASAFTVYFLLRVLAALGERERELTDARSLAARQERLASLATMAAGAAHELSTPLATVALAAKELERALERAGGAAPLVDDARLIREQVGRCRVILDQMAGSTAVGEGIEELALGEILDDGLQNLRVVPAVWRAVPAEVARLRVRLPRRALGQALRSLVTNAQDASPADLPVEVAAAHDGERVAVTISDRGPGMEPALLARVGEPFFTTKAPGRGMGLGMFLARAVVESLGGTVVLDSVVGRGTRVTITVPTHVAEPAGAPRA
jgi:two-component system sensor histidine kinase RegB